MRPLAYQAHLYELRTKLVALRDAYRNDPNQVATCSTLQSQVDDEIDNKHHLRRVPAVTGLPAVNPPYQSTHSAQPAKAIDMDLSALSIQQLVEVDLLASLSGLHRPCVTSAHPDTPHFTLLGTPCDQLTIQGTAQSPVNIVIRDPSGRQVGYDSTAGTIVNDIGSRAFYSGPLTEPQLIEIGGAVPGHYLLTAVATGAGPYALTLATINEQVDSDNIVASSGAVSPGQILSLGVDVLLSVDISVNPNERSNEERDNDSGAKRDGGRDARNLQLPTIDLREEDDVEVAILSSNVFDATLRVDSNSLTFGRTGDERSLRSCERYGEDINGDGIPDLVCHFRIGIVGFQPTDALAILRGRTVDGTPIEGNEMITTR
jgi:hypothetical protein